jgi:hypothetical protein
MRLDEIDRTKKEIGRIKERISYFQDNYLDRKIS